MATELNLKDPSQQEQTQYQRYSSCYKSLLLFCHFCLDKNTHTVGLHGYLREQVSLQRMATGELNLCPTGATTKPPFRDSSPGSKSQKNKGQLNAENDFVMPR